MTRTEIAALAVSLASDIPKCRSTEQLIELLTAHLDLAHCGGKIAGTEQIAARLAGNGTS